MKWRLPISSSRNPVFPRRETRNENHGEIDIDSYILPREARLTYT
jgi:hypothetical protein